MSPAVRALLVELLDGLDQAVAEGDPEIVARVARLKGATGEDGYTQTQRPPWLATKNLYLRAWSVLHAENHPGLRALGHVRWMSHAAAIEWRDRRAEEPHRRTLPTPAAPPSRVGISKRLDAELGIVDRRKAVGK